MRTPSVLGLVLAWLLVLPIGAAAASGLPATITMDPESAGPGSVVDVVGLDFPEGQAIKLQLTTTAGPIQLGTTTTEAGGYFRQRVTFPEGIVPGFWELRATSANDTVAVHIFEAAMAPLAAPVSEVVEATEVAASGSPIIDGTTLVVLVLAILIAAVGGAGAYVWHQTRRPETQPGMSSGEDPIWGGAHSDPL